MLARLRRLSFRHRLTLAAAAAGAIAIAAASTITFVVVRDRLYSQVDDSLRSEAARMSSDKEVTGNFIGEAGPQNAIGKKKAIAAQEMPPPLGVEPAGQKIEVAPPKLGSDVTYAQTFSIEGGVTPQVRVKGNLPAGARVLELARIGMGSSFSNQNVAGAHMRVFTQAVKPGAVLQVARPLDEIDGFVKRLGVILILVGIGGIALAFGLALWLTRTAAKPLTALSEATEHVARTRDLTRRIDASSDDELGRLGASFNTMLEELDDSMRSQRQLVADASHELRTPLTTLRTNLEVFARSDAARGSAQQRLVGDLVGQIGELTALVGDLVELARDDEQPARYAEDVRLDEVVAGVVERARRRHPERGFAVDAEPTVVHAVPERLDRAIANLVDNAEKWSPSGAQIDIAVRGGELVVRDHGPGIDDSDLPFVFDRFYRAPAARGLPGSGLGLAIVRRVAEESGGSVSAEHADGGGARLVLRIPAASKEIPKVGSAGSNSAAAEWAHEIAYPSRGARPGLGRRVRLRRRG
jgi:two-component system sensor histidine kinase MprB